MYYLLVDEELDPLGLLEDDAAPPGDDVEPPLPADEPMPPAVLEEPPVPELELVESGVELGAVAVDDEEDPPGTTTVSFSFVVLLVDDAPLGEVVVDPPGTTVVVSFFSHAASAKAPTSTNKYPLRFISTLLLL